MEVETRFERGADQRLCTVRLLGQITKSHIKLALALFLQQGAPGEH